MFDKSNLLAAIRNTLPWYEVLSGRNNQMTIITNRFLMQSEKRFDFDPSVSLLAIDASS